MSEIPSWLLILSVSLPLTGAIIGYLTLPEYQPVNTRALLTTLARVQAGVLAIVFSVTVIGIQLTASRYSPRLSSLFTKSPIFIFTFSLFIISIGLDLFLLYTVPEAFSRTHTAGVYAAAGLALSSAINLYEFIQKIVQQSTPEGLVDTFARRMTVDRFLEKGDLMVSDRSNQAHPLRPLYSICMAAISNNERENAEFALTEYNNLTSELLKEAIECGAFESSKYPLQRKLVRPILTEHLHDIALRAEREGEPSFVRDAIEQQYELGKIGLSSPGRTIPLYAISGFRQVIVDSPLDTGHYTSNEIAWTNLGKFMVTVSEQSKPKIVCDAVSPVQHHLRQKIWQAQDIQMFRGSMVRLYSSLEETQKNLLDDLDQDITTANTDWEHGMISDDVSVDQLGAINEWKKALLTSTSAFLDYQFRKRELPITRGNFKNNWKNICLDAANSEADDYAVVLCQALIEVAYFEYQTNNEGDPRWADTIARVKLKSDSEVVEEAFERILSYEFQEDHPPLIHINNMAEINEKYYQNLLNIEGFGSLNTLSDFPDTIKKLRSDSQKRTVELKETEVGD